MSEGPRTINGWVLIERPIMDVFGYVCDPGRLTEWVPIYSAVDVPPGRGHVKEGTTFRATVGAAAFGIPETITCVNVVPGRSVTFRSQRFTQTATYIFEPTSEGTLLTGMHTPWAWAALTPWIDFIRPWAEQFVNQTLLHLKQRLEAMRFRESDKLIFFSYRRKNDKYIGGRVCEGLAREFGEGAIFRDVDAIRLGNFQRRIEAALEQCKIVIAFIGPGWLQGFKDKERQGRKDWVLEELKIALKMNRKQGKEILPVLVDGAFPKATSLDEEIAQLPKEVRGLGRFQIHRLRPDPDFKADMERLSMAAWTVISGDH